MFGDQFTVILEREDGTSLTRDDMTPAEVEDVLTSAMALSGRAWDAGIAFNAGISDKVTYSWRGNGPEDWLGSERKLTVIRNVKPGAWLDKYVEQQAEQAAFVFGGDVDVTEYTEADEVADATENGGKS